MDAKKLGVQAAAVTDDAVQGVLRAVQGTKSGVGEFWGAFRTELQARRAARQAPSAPVALLGFSRAE